MLFQLGLVGATPRALGALRRSGLSAAAVLRRHAGGDWGEVCAHDREQNALGLRHGGRLISAYTTPRGEALWVLTEADRSQTTIRLTDEY
jgi:hypothetical protein